MASTNVGHFPTRNNKREICGYRENSRGGEIGNFGVSIRHFGQLDGGQIMNKNMKCISNYTTYQYKKFPDFFSVSAGNLKPENFSSLVLNWPQGASHGH